MVDVEVRIHDRFSVEFKIGYVVRKELKDNDFMMNTWIFVPHSLDINSFTYSKNQFYRDVKSNIRLITPIYSLNEVADKEALPFRFLEVAFYEFAADPTKENLNEAEYQIKMFCSITKSALRREVEQIVKHPQAEERLSLIDHYINRCRQITERYQKFKEIIQSAREEVQVFYSFGDEFLSNTIEVQTFRLLERLQKKDLPAFQQAKPGLMQLITEGIAYRRQKGFLIIEKESPDRNRTTFFRLRMLRKYTESHLFLNATKKKDGQMAEQVYLSVAAGISMIFATAIAFSFQQKYGNFTMPFFVALVVSYMLKDRIKELTRYYFVHRLSKKYFDNKTVIKIKDTPIGWIKEGVDFITDERVPDEIMEMRGRSNLLEANNRDSAEKIILYRTFVRIDGEALDESNQYNISGINNILRFNVSSFILKMDNPDVPLAVPDNNGGYEMISGERIYYINFLIQVRYDNQIHYKRFRLIMSRNGIEGIEKM